MPAPTPQSKRSSISHNRSRSVFVGRQQEIAELRDALDDALSGQGRMVMLVGEPGIGKTRTAQELASRAEAQGVQVLWGRCFEEEGAPPYWPWVQPIRSYIEQQGQSQLQYEMGPGAADIAEIVPELREKLAGLEPSPALEPEQARFRLFDSIASFLKSASQTQAMMVVLDDLQWADRSSLLLLEFLVGQLDESRIVLIGTYRDVEVSRQHPLSQTLGNLVREQVFQRVQLAGLNRAEVAHFVEVASGVSPLPGLVEAVYARTEGNPLFVGEIIGMLPSDGLEEGRDYLTSIPEGVRDAIGQRLNRLSEGCNQVLTTASVVGREFDFRLLSALMDDFTEAQLLGLLEEALEAHVIEEVSAGEERYQFSHALIQETLAGELSAARRVRLHARIGQALEELYGSDAEAHAAELAHHFAEAEPVLGPGKLVRYSLMAGQQALSAFSWEEALDHFQRALDAKERHPLEAGVAATLLFGLGRAQAATLERRRLPEAVATLERALESFAAAGEMERVVAVAEYPFYPLIGQASGNAQRLRRALALVEPESHQAGRLYPATAESWGSRRETTG